MRPISAVAMAQRRKPGCLPSLGCLAAIPVLPDFHVRYPEIALETDFVDRIIERGREEVYCVVRSGELSDLLSTTAE